MPTERLGQLLRGYRTGVASALLATLAASGIATPAGWPSPLESPAEQLIEATPVSIAELIIAHLWSIARPLAFLGGLAIVLLFGGLGGVLFVLARGPATESRQHTHAARFALGMAVACLFFAAAFTQLFPPVRLQPTIALIATYVVILAVLLTGSRKPNTAISGRREFLVQSGFVLSGAALSLGVFSLEPLLHGLKPRRILTFHAPEGLAVAGLTPLVTPVEQFYVMGKVLQPPVIDLSDWHLTIGGHVEHPGSIRYADLLSRVQRSRYVTMECVDNPVGGPLMSCALFTGVPLRQLLAEIGAMGTTIAFRGADGYEEALPASELLRAGAMIAYAMNGVTLTREHGYPVRLLVPGLYGFKSVKWLEHIEVGGDITRDIWTARGWTAGAHIKTTTRIDVARRLGDEIFVAGVAFAGTRGVQSVQVRVDHRGWRKARLGHRLSGTSWVQWMTFAHSPAPAFVEARSIDGQGVVQSSERHDSYPDGASGWASTTV